MRMPNGLPGLAVSLAAVAFAPAAVAQHTAATPMTDEQMIASAMQAAPESIAKTATIVAIESDGKTRVLRKGTDNLFTCIPDNPESPGPDPMCGDRNAMEWAQAWIGHKEPPANKVGFMYMLAGGTDASNTDPYATRPEPGNNWIETGAHVMIVGASKLMEGYPRDAKPDTAQPYVMWPGTPYEHLMIPVK